MFRSSFPAVISLVLLAGCANPPPYRYHYVRGRTAELINGHAIAPPGTPSDVQAAIAAGNRIAGLPYAYGAGHANTFDGAYDCSGAASFLLEAAGRLNAPMPAHEFRHYGESGYGKWITVYARRDHVFLVVAGLRFDTGWTNAPEGPQWTTQSRPAKGCVLRHPDGL